MFDLSFFKLIVVAVVALIVIGPERLPKVARTAGILFSRLQRYASTVKADISRELELEELRRLRKEVEESARQIERTVQRELQGAETAIRQPVEQEIQQIRQDLQPESSVEEPARRTAAPIDAGSVPAEQAIIAAPSSSADPSSPQQELDLLLPEPVSLEPMHTPLGGPANQAPLRPES